MTAYQTQIIQGASGGAVASELLDRTCGIFAEDKSMEARRDNMIGEMANTISGNASEAFGRDFQISVPLVITGNPEGVDLLNRAPGFVVPVQWKTHKAYLVVGVE